jgi:hypothetical protein
MSLGATEAAVIDKTREKHVATVKTGDVDAWAAAFADDARMALVSSHKGIVCPRRAALSSVLPRGLLVPTLGGAALEQRRSTAAGPTFLMLPRWC